MLNQVSYTRCRGQSVGGQTFVEAEIWTVAQTDQGNVVLIRPKGSELAVPIFIGQLETQSILIGMGAVEVPRPLTHDLLLSAIAALGAQLSRVEIYELREGTFYARLIMKAEGGEFMIDARPSDAIGLAVRAPLPGLHRRERGRGSGHLSEPCDRHADRFERPAGRFARARAPGRASRRFHPSGRHRARFGERRDPAPTV